MAEYNIGDKFVIEIINKTDEPLAPYISGTTKNVTVYQLKGIPFMLDADTLSNFERFEERKKGNWIPVTERLPDDGTYVLISFKRNMAVAYRWVGRWHVMCGGGWKTPILHGEQEPTHWMPLPEPPKEEI